MLCATAGVLSVNVFWDSLYLTGIVLGSPFLTYRLIKSPEYRDGISEKIGFVPRRRGDKKCVWIHGVSVGEVIASQPLINAMRSEQDDVEVLLTTTTTTGYQVAQHKQPQLSVHYFPLDFSFIAQRVIRRFRPSVIVLMELELWPNFLIEASRLNVPVIVVNGRISEKSFNIYRGSWKFLARALNSIKCYSVQTQQYADRLVELGIPPETVVVTGNMKYDAVISSVPENPGGERTALGIAPDEIVFTAGSTHASEEEAAVDAWQAARKAAEAPVRLIVVPRHPPRIPEVLEMLNSKGLGAVRKSRIKGSLEKDTVIVGDTMGEMMKIYAASDIVFIGGSLIPHGGQNMIEPVACKKATLWGPHTHNFTETVEQLAEAKGGITLKDKSQLAADVARLACDDRERERLARSGYEVIRDRLGATRRNLEIIRSFIPG